MRAEAQKQMKDRQESLRKYIPHVARSLQVEGVGLGSSPHFAKGPAFRALFLGGVSQYVVCVCRCVSVCCLRVSMRIDHANRGPCHARCLSNTRTRRDARCNSNTPLTQGRMHVVYASIDHQMTCYPHSSNDILRTQLCVRNMSFLLRRVRAGGLRRVSWHLPSLFAAI